MKTTIYISAAIVLGAYILQAQPKYTNVPSNQSAYKVQNLDGYKETGAKMEDRNAFKNAQNYKSAPTVKPEAKGEGIFPVLPEGVNENSLVAVGNYKAQFTSPKKSPKARGNSIPNDALPVNNQPNDASSKEYTQ